MITSLRSWRVSALPHLLFPTVPVSAARWLALLPVLGTLAACWGAGFTRYGKTAIAVLVATVLVMLGICLLAGIRAVVRLIAHRSAAADAGRGGSVAEDVGPMLVILALPCAGLLALVGLAVMGVMTAGGLDSPTAPALNFPAQMGIWLWIAHEIYYSIWEYRRTLAERRTPSDTV